MTKSVLAVVMLLCNAIDKLFTRHYAMQYLATLDAEELIVQDCERKCLIEIAWRVFHSQTRGSLDGPAENKDIY